MKFLLDHEETPRILFRRIELTDFDAWLEFFKHPSSFEHWVSERQQPGLECKQWYAKQFNRYETDQGGMNAVIEKSTGKLIGHAGLLVQHVDGIEELEVAYSLVPAFRNKGFASEAAVKCKEFAFQNNLTPSLISIISLTNTPSANVALKNGMKIEKQTTYNQNPVNIFRIHKTDWGQQGPARWASSL
jgi:[ribosomal protein S5]-alanine N-acetyltransferase